MRKPKSFKLWAVVTLSSLMFFAGAGLMWFHSMPRPAFAAEAARGSAKVTIADVAQQALPSVVSIATTKIVKAPNLQGHPFFQDPFFRRFFGDRFRFPRGNQRMRGLGSGVIVSSDGVILTNNHVVSAASQIWVTTADRRHFKAKVIGADERSDVAVLKIKGRVRNLKPLRFGDSDRLRLGDVVLAIGNPFGMSQTVTMGIISAKGRANVGIVDYEDFIQTDAAINPGNSGGALVSMDGKLVGIATAILSRTGGYQGIGLAIPVNMARPIMKSLLKHGHVVRGWLGIYIQDVTPGLSKALKLRTKRGVLVAKVQRKSPAHRAGLRRDDVIVKIDGKPMDASGKFRNYVASRGPRKRVTLHLQRGARNIRVSIRLGTLSSKTARAVTGKPKVDSLAGLTVTALTRDLRRRFAVPNDVKKGVLVTRVVGGSAADLYGIRPGDVIVEVNRVPVRSVRRFRSRFRRSHNRVLLRVAGRTGTRYVVLSK